MNQDLKKNVSSGHIWFRLLYMILFAFVLQVAVAVFWVVAVIQFLFSLLTGQPNGKLGPFSDSLVKYITQCFNFECFLSEEKPFPFSDFPDSDIKEDEFSAQYVEEVQVEDDSPAEEVVEAEAETVNEEELGDEKQDDEGIDDKK